VAFMFWVVVRYVMSAGKPKRTSISCVSMGQFAPVLGKGLRFWLRWEGEAPAEPRWPEKRGSAGASPHCFNDLDLP
jgi:hypothetical protein